MQRIIMKNSKQSLHNSNRKLGKNKMIFVLLKVWLLDISILYGNQNTVIIRIKVDKHATHN